MVTSDSDSLGEIHRDKGGVKRKRDDQLVTKEGGACTKLLN